MRITVQRLVVATTVVMAVVLVGLALRTRNGQTYATGEVPVITITAPGTQTVHADTEGLLVPGGRADLLLSVQNDSTHTMILRAVRQAGTAAVVDGGCTVDTSMISVFDETRLTMIVPPGHATLRLENAVYMDKHIGEPCTGGVFRIPVTISVAA